MDKELKNGSGIVSNPNGKTENTGNRRKTSQPGAPAKSNRQTKGKDEAGENREA